MRKYFFYPVILMLLVITSVIFLWRSGEFNSHRSLNHVLNKVESVELGIVTQEVAQRYNNDEFSFYMHLIQQLRDAYDLKVAVNTFDTVDDLILALENDEVQMALTNEGVEGWANGVHQYSIPLFNTYGIYTKDYQQVEDLTDLDYTTISYVEALRWEELRGYFTLFNYDQSQYDSYDSILRKVVDQDEVQVLMPYAGRIVALEGGQNLYLTYELNEFSFYNYVYVSKSFLPYWADIYEWFDKAGHEFLEDIEFQETLRNGQVRFKKLAEREGLSVEGIKVLYANEDVPLVLEERGVLHGVMSHLLNHIGRVAEIDIDYVNIEEQASGLYDEDGGNAIYTTGALEYLGMKTPKNHTALLTNPLLVVGRMGSDDYVNINDLAPARVGLYYQANLEKAIQTMYPKSSTMVYYDSEAAIKALSNNQIDYLLMDEYKYNYLILKNLTRDLSIVGIYNNANSVYLYGPEGQEDVIRVLELAIDQIHPEPLILEALEEISDIEDDSEVMMVLYFLVVVLLIIVVVLLVRGIRLRSERKMLDYLSGHDPQTGALNLYGLRREVQDEGRQLEHLFICIDIIGFRRINETYTYSHGNTIIKEFIQHLQNESGSDAYVARTGGDEFTVALEMDSIKDAKESWVKALHDRMTKHLKDLTDLDMKLVFGVSSLGRSDDFDAVFSDAERAMSNGKKERVSGVLWYSAALRKKLEEDRGLAKALVKAFENKELIMHYQPQINLEDGTVVGGEALVRWQHPTLGLLPPGRFLRIMRSEKMMRKLDWYVLEEVSCQISKWVKDGFNVDKISLNITPMTFTDDNFLDNLIKLTRKYKEVYGRLCLEITEDFQLSNADKYRNLMDGIRDLGICIAIDDFGVGYSSLSYLVQYPIDRVKIDRTLVANVDTRVQDYDLVKGIIQVLQDLDKNIVIEGVENQRQIDKLSIFDDLIIQGYYYSKPRTVEDFEKEYLGSMVISSQEKA